MLKDWLEGQGHPWELMQPSRLPPLRLSSTEEVTRRDHHMRVASMEVWQGATRASRKPLRW